MRDWEAIVAAYQGGQATASLAAKHGFHPQTLYYQLRKRGIARRPSNHFRMRKVDIGELSCLLDARRLTIEQIAAHFGVSIPSIVRRMRRHGLKSRRGHGSPLETNFFWQGGTRRETEGYLLVKAPGHPYATKQGYVRKHRLVVEQRLGRYLLPTEVVHHKDGNPRNNDPANLEVFRTHAAHMRHEWQENWYPQIEQLRDKFRRKRQPQANPNPRGSGTDAAGSP